MTPFFPSQDDWRGAYCYDAVKSLMENGKYDVKVFTGKDRADYEYQGITVHTFKTCQLPSAIFPFLFAGKNQRSFIQAVMRAGIDLKNVAVCHGHTAFYGIYPLAVKKVNSNCLTLLHHHDLASFGLNMGGLRHCWLYNLIEFPILRKIHERIDCHVFISEASRRSFLAAPDTSWAIYDDYKKQMRWLPYSGVKISRSIIMHNGVNTDIFKSNGSSAVANDDKPYDATIGCIGNFTENKGQMTLLKAVRRLRKLGINVKVKFVGSGPKLEEHKQYVLKNDMQHCVSFMAEMRHEELPEFYRSLDLFVLPSYFEGFGCVFTEAWACGTPFITCKGQGMDDMIPDNECGTWLVEPKDDEQLANVIANWILNHPDQHLKSEIAIQPITNHFVEKLELEIEMMQQRNNSLMGGRPK